MAPSTPAALLCAKCGAGAAEDQSICAKCGGSVVKVCGKCGFKNSPAKSYCDQCGAALELGAAVISPPTLEQNNPIPATAIRHQSSPAPDKPRKASAPSRGQKKSNHFLLRGISVALGLALAASGAALYMNLNSPRRILPRLAADYLSRLSRGDIEGAYAYLSSAAKSVCSLEDFRAARENVPWTWSDVALVRLGADTAVVRYTLAVTNRPPEDDYLSFIRENGQWKRPFNWNLFKKIEDAFAAHNPDLAAVIAQEALSVNPRDPMAQGYLCEAVFYRHDPAQTVSACAQALALAAAYPSRLSAKSLYHLHALLGDTYKNTLHRYPEAITEYDAMLAFPGLSNDDRCNLLLARADTSILMGNSDPARHDLDAAAPLCVKQDDQTFIARARAKLR